MKMELQLKGHCYVLKQGNWIHPIAERRHDLLWYPERAMTLHDQYLYRPYVQSIVTENPWLIGLYDRERVMIVEEDGSWRTPPYQTYGASNDMIVTHILGITSSVAGQVLDGGRCFKKAVREYKKRIAKANKLYTI